MLRIYTAKDFEPAWRVNRTGGAPPDVARRVAEILAAVQREGDIAVARLTRELDRFEIEPDALEVDRATWDAAVAQVPGDVLELLRFAAERVRRFHERQVQQGFSYEEADGTRLGQRVLPLERVGIYVPGGTAAYPSSVLMNAIPARVAGVDEIVMVTPTPDGVLNPLVVAAASVAGVDRLFRIGGAQAVAALAYGTASVPVVDKIVGPGNIWVATAKRLVFGAVDIDSIAGPSEVLVVADETADADIIAADLLAQAEHDADATAGLITTHEPLIAAVCEALERRLATLPRRAIAAASIRDHGYAVLAADRAEALRLANEVAAEHLELAIDDPWSAVDEIRHAGAIFVGEWTPEAVGDYVAGPNHVLPTSGTARFFSGLGVGDFLKRVNVLGLSPAGLRALGPATIRLAELEGLDAHARSVAVRLERLEHLAPSEAGHV